MIQVKLSGGSITISQLLCSLNADKAMDHVELFAELEKIAYRYMKSVDKGEEHLKTGISLGIFNILLNNVAFGALDGKCCKNQQRKKSDFHFF